MTKSVISLSIQRKQEKVSYGCGIGKDQWHTNKKCRGNKNSFLEKNGFFILHGTEAEDNEDAISTNWPGRRYFMAFLSMYG